MTFEELPAEVRRFLEKAKEGQQPTSTMNASNCWTLAQFVRDAVPMLTHTEYVDLISWIEFTRRQPEEARNWIDHFMDPF